MKSLKYLFTGILLLATFSNLFAHALFIETDAEGKKGSKQEIIIFYAEPSDPKREIIEDWWSDTKEFSLWLTLPNGTKEKLAVSQQKNHFTSSFTPLLNGDYYISVHHTVANLAGKTQYQFNTSTMVKVGSQNELSNLNQTVKSDELLMYVESKTNKKELSIAVKNNREPLVDTYITIFAPNGWQKNIKTNKEGVASFEPEWKGTYLFEASKKEKVTNQDYTDKHRIITTTVNFK